MCGTGRLSDCTSDRGCSILTNCPPSTCYFGSVLTRLASSSTSLYSPRVSTFSRNQSVTASPLLRITIRQEGYTVFHRSDGERLNPPKLSSSHPPSSSLSSGGVYRASEVAAADAAVLKFKSLPICSLNHQER